jgi:hypothetical protein
MTGAGVIAYFDQQSRIFEMLWVTKANGPLGFGINGSEIQHVTGTPLDLHALIIT